MNPFLRTFPSALEEAESVEIAPGPNYLIWITARSGSTFLTHTLRDAGGLGYPDEWFNYDSVATVAKQNRITSFAEYVDFIFRERRSDNGVFGVEMTWPFYSALRELIDVDSIFGSAPQFFLRRRNLIAQAISLHIAIQSGVWHSYQAGNDDAQKAIDAVAYDADQIASYGKAIIGQESRIVRHLESAGTVALDMYHEDVVKDPGGTVAFVRNALRGVAKIPLPKPLNENPMKRMGGSRNREWEQRFRCEQPATVEELVALRPCLRVPCQTV